MSRSSSAYILLGLAWMLALAVPACTPRQATIETATAIVKASAAPVSAAPSVAAAGRSLPLPSATETVTPTPVSAKVIVVASRGNLFIRRGPDLAYNPLSVLYHGQSAQALARDVLAGWVEIAFPDQPLLTGWISVQTKYSAVKGDLMGLPEVEPTDWPVPASVLNCSNEEMLISPGNIVLPSVDNFPYNDVSVSPGTYEVLDTDIDPPYPVVLTVNVREGSSILVGTDGQKKSCPIPYEPPTPRCAKKPGHRLVAVCPTPP